MPEAIQPPIKFDNRFAPADMRGEFARDVFELVNVYNEPAYVEVGERVALVPLVSTMVPKPDGGDTAIRISGVPAFSGEPEEISEVQTDVFKPSKDYYVVEIEHSPAQASLEDVQEAELDWLPYLALIVNVANLQEIDVVDPETGRSFTETEVVDAMFVLNLIRRQLRADEFSNRLYMDAVGNANSIMNKQELNYDDWMDDGELPLSGLIPFDRGMFIQNPGCDACFGQGEDCPHVSPNAEYN